MTSTIGERFAASKSAVKQERGGYGPEFSAPDLDVKSLMTTASSWAPDSPRDSATVVGAAVRQPTLLDLVPTTQVNTRGIYSYMEETTFTDNAAEVAEGGTYGEAGLGFTERYSPVCKVSIWLPVTDGQLEDVGGLPGYVDQRLGFMLRRRLELQMLVGNGASSNLRGITQTPGIQTQAKGADTAAVAIRKAKTKVQTPGYGTPDLLVIHPSDSEEIDLAAAADPQAPFVVTNDVWDVPRQEIDALTAGTAVVGDFSNYCALKVQRGITLQVTHSHGTFFVEGKQAIRADIRVAFAVFRPAAFCTVTGI